MASRFFRPPALETRKGTTPGFGYQNPMITGTHNSITIAYEKPFPISAPSDSHLQRPFGWFTAWCSRILGCCDARPIRQLTKGNTALADQHAFTLPGGLDSSIIKTTLSPDWTRDSLVSPPDLIFQCGGASSQHPLKPSRWKANCDRYAATLRVIGVADGVNSVAEEGVDPSELPTELIALCCCLADARDADKKTFDRTSQRLCERAGLLFRSTEFIRHIVSRAAAALDSLGSTTLCLGVVRKGRLYVANVGDSGLFVFRLGVSDHGSVSCRPSSAELGTARYTPGGGASHNEDNRSKQHYRLLARTVVGCHSFNNPCQITRMPDPVTPSATELFKEVYLQTAITSVTLEDGDVIVAGTDGLLDNLYPAEIMGILDNVCLPTVADPQSAAVSKVPLVPPEKVAKALFQKAVQNAQSHKGSTAVATPYSDAIYAITGRQVNGGKPDDTTVVVAYVQAASDPRESPLAWRLSARSNHLTSLKPAVANAFAECNAALNSVTPDTVTPTSASLVVPLPEEAEGCDLAQTAWSWSLPVNRPLPSKHYMSSKCSANVPYTFRALSRKGDAPEPCQIPALETHMCAAIATMHRSRAAWSEHTVPVSSERLPQTRVHPSDASSVLDEKIPATEPCHNSSSDTCRETSNEKLSRSPGNTQTGTASTVCTSVGDVFCGTSPNADHWHRAADSHGLSASKQFRGSFNGPAITEAKRVPAQPILLRGLPPLLTEAVLSPPICITQPALERPTAHTIDEARLRGFRVRCDANEPGTPVSVFRKRRAERVSRWGSGCVLPGEGFLRSPFCWASPKAETKKKKTFGCSGMPWF